MDRATSVFHLILPVCLMLLANCQSITESNGAAPAPAGEGVHPIAGVWTNPAYDNEGRSGRVVYTPKPDGSFAYSAFDRSDGSGEEYTGNVVYKKIWTDAKGFHYGISTVTLTEYGMSWETLDRISPDGKSLEVQSGVTEINPKGPRYSIYFRK